MATATAAKRRDSTAADRRARARHEARQFDEVMARTRDSASGPALRDRELEPGNLSGLPEDTRDERAQQRYATARQVAPTQSIGRQNYQPIILMEYVGCLLLTVTTPIATKKAANGLSPYAGADMVKIASITLLYFILAAISTGGRGPGRFAAWFGGLILIVDGMYEASNLAKDFGLFTGGLASAASGTSSAAAAVPDVGLTSPSTVQGVIESALNPGLLPQSQQSTAQTVAAQQGGGSIVAPGWRGAV